MLSHQLRRHAIPGSHAGINSSLRHRSSHPRGYPLVKRADNNIILPELIIRYQGCNGSSCSNLHLGIDIRSPHIQSTTENTRKGQQIIHLIREIRAAGADNTGTSFFSQLRHNLRLRIRHSHNDGIPVHGLHHFLSYAFCHRNTDKYIGSLNYISQGTGFPPPVGDSGNILLVRVHALGTALINSPLGITKNDMPGSYSLQETGNSHASSTGTIYNNLGIAEPLANQLEAIHQCRYSNYSSTMLVIMENRNIHGFLQAVLNIKALRCLDILQVNAAKARLQHLHSMTNIIHIAGVQAKRHGIHTGKTLEKNRFSLHNRQSGTCSNIAQPQHSSAIGYHSHHIGFGSIIINLVIIFLYFQARCRNTRRICQGQILGGTQIHLADNFQLTLIFLMQFQRCLIYVTHTYHTFPEFYNPYIFSV